MFYSSFQIKLCGLTFTSKEAENDPVLCSFGAIVDQGQGDLCDWHNIKLAIPKYMIGYPCFQMLRSTVMINIKHFHPFQKWDEKAVVRSVGVDYDYKGTRNV